MVYVLYGTVDYLIKKQVENILKENDIEQISISKYNLANELLKDIINDAESISLFTERKAILVENAYIFTGSNNKKNSEQDTILLEKYLENNNSDTVLIFIVNNEKLDERKKITKLVKKYGTVKEFNHVDTIEIVKTLFDNYQIKEDIIRYLIERVGDNISILSNEIEKIKLYKNDDKIITKEDVENLTSKSPEVNNFKLIDAIISKNKALAIELYEERLKLNEEPIAIIIALANQIRIMYQVKELYLMGHTEHDIANQLNIHPYRVKLASQNARKYDSNTLLRYLEELANLDINIKTGQVDKELGLELFILGI